MKFAPDSSKLKADEFWTATKNYVHNNPRPSKYTLQSTTSANIDSLINLVLNPPSHNDVNRYEYSNEIALAIATIKTLKAELKV